MKKGITNPENRIFEALQGNLLSLTVGGEILFYRLLKRASYMAPKSGSRPEGVGLSGPFR
jgi:hypothetical protein